MSWPSVFPCSLQFLSFHFTYPLFSYLELEACGSSSRSLYPLSPLLQRIQPSVTHVSFQMWQSREFLMQRQRSSDLGLLLTILHCQATESLRRSLFGDSLSLYNLWITIVNSSFLQSSRGAVIGKFYYNTNNLSIN